MKTLYLIGGTMGVGKTTLGQYMKIHLENAVYLDGDWCWDSHPFVVNDTTKAMVMNNICFLLNSFIDSDCYENIIFTWVMHQQEIIDEIISKLHLDDVKVKCISLVCKEQTLKNHILKDVNENKRDIEVLNRSIERLPLYEKLNTTLIQIDGLTLEEIMKKCQLD